MKQVIQTLSTGEITVNDVPIPALKDKYVLVRNTHSIISSGTEKTKIDMGKKNLIEKARARPDLVKQVINKLKNEGLVKTLNTVRSRLESPSPLGYSCSGEVIAVGGLVNGLKVGDRVACGGADFANHAEFNSVPMNLVVKIPAAVSNEEAAFTTVGSIALQGVRLAQTQIGETFLVVGLGLIGQIVCQILKSSGCNVIGLDIDKNLVKKAEKIGVTPSTYDDCLSICDDLTDAHGVDGVLVCAGTTSNQPIELAGKVTREKGRVIVVGAVKMDIPREDYFKKEINVVISRSYGPGRYDPVYEEGGNDYPFGYVRFTEKRNMKSFLELISNRQIDIGGLISHRFSMEDAPSAYDLIEGRKQEEYMGIVLEYAKNQKDNNSSKITNQAKPYNKESLNISFFGAGNYATATLLPVLKRNKKINFNGVVTASGRTAEAVSKKFKFNFCSSQFEDLLKSETDVVFITSRHNDHAKSVILSANADKDVYVEKPLALSFKELSEIHKTLAKKKSFNLMVGFNRRFSPHVKAITNIFPKDSKSMVINIRVNAGKIDKDHWIQDPDLGGGRIIGEVCHFIDLASALSNSVPVKVYTTSLCKTNDTSLNTDNVSINIEFSSGAIANIVYTSEGSQAVSKEYVEIFCEGKTAIIDDFKKLEISEGTKIIYSSKLGSQDKGQTLMIKQWIDCIHSGQQCIPYESLILNSLTAIQAVESIMTDTPLKVEMIAFE